MSKNASSGKSEKLGAEQTPPQLPSADNLSCTSQNLNTSYLLLFEISIKVASYEAAGSLNAYVGEEGGVGKGADIKHMPKATHLGP